MNRFKNLLTFSEVTTELGCKPGEVRTLVVEERRLPALYVTLMGHIEPYDRQVIHVDDSGMAFDLCKGYENPPHVGYLRVQRTALQTFREGNAVVAGSCQPEEKPLGTTERNTLMKLVIGMAIKGYNHDPTASKSTAPKEIADDLALLDMKIDTDTVRKHLKRAADTVLPAKPRQP